MRHLTCETSSFHFNTVISAVSEIILSECPTLPLPKLVDVLVLLGLGFGTCSLWTGACAESGLWQLALHVLNLDCKQSKRRPPSRQAKG